MRELLNAVLVLHCHGPRRCELFETQVKDDGVGIAPDLLDAILQPFVQVSDVTVHAGVPSDAVPRHCEV